MAKYASGYRRGLARYHDKVLTCYATVKRYGEMKLKHLNTSVITQTLLLKNIFTRTGEMLADHVWIPLSDRIRDLDLRHGDQILFTGRVVSYRKGRQLEMTDYHFTGIDDCRKVDKIQLY